MPRTEDARYWLRKHGYGEVADRIDGLMKAWKRAGKKTRRNWWDVLAGTEAGTPRIIEGTEFPILAAARERKGWPLVPDAISRPGEEPPEPAIEVRRSTSTKSRSGTTSASADELLVENFAHLDRVRVPLTDLLVLVGPQATGKSLVLEILKLAEDRHRIVRSLKQYGFAWQNEQEFAQLFFGGGFATSWTRDTRVRHRRKDLTLRQLAKSPAKRGDDTVFYIPAHRTLAIGEGWPRPFTEYNIETPYVARRFSEVLLNALNQGLVGKGKIFPHDRRLKAALRDLIDESVFHGATLKLSRMSGGMRKQFVLQYDKETTLPFMAWTAGQREFTPLLLGLYLLLPSGGGPKKREIEWAILEEPEMGLHPKAIVAVMAVVIDLLARGYKVALSTHSPSVLSVVWGMSRLKSVQDGPRLLCEMMGLPKQQTLVKSAAKALKKTYGVVNLYHHEDSGLVVSKDISNLDPGASDQREWGWGGLTGFSARIADVVAKSRT